MRLEGKVAIVTGGGSGLGEATCLRLAEAGASVAATDIDGENAERVASAIRERGEEAIALTQDVADEAGWQEVIGKTLERYQRFDILVNNAGIVLPANVEDTTLEDWRTTHRVNLDGVFLGCRAAVRSMKKSGGGSIINISSIEGIVG
ncbi:MAG: SDR family NAD(P)-dependent oxidoreductase, partial [Deltaproteobacteria bacterium]|nr:SDR family NAD(P)-dependent oxidoreductase [Deltaproteobacteria bacterium]